MPHSKKAFSLVELIVVIAVIALIVSITMPYLGGIFAVYRNAACQSHLEKLGQAYAMVCTSRRQQHSMNNGLGTREWQGQLLPYVSQDVEVFYCPEDDGAAMGRKATLGNYYMDVYPGGNFAGSVCLSEGEGEFVWKLSQTQWDTFRTLAEQNGRQSHGYNHPGYVPDDNPNKYYFAFEDMAWSSGPDRDFWDLNFQVEVQGLDIHVTIVHGETGYDHYLFLGPPEDPDRIKLFPNTLKSHAGQSITVAGESASNYGMNSVAGKIDAGEGNKIIIMDYNLLLAAGSPYDETSGDRSEQLVERWQPDANNPDGPLPFARHFGKCNVLFAGGKVLLMDPDEIHPDDVEAQEKYWDP